jgi:hypothetical protein
MPLAGTRYLLDLDQTTGTGGYGFESLDALITIYWVAATVFSARGRSSHKSGGAIVTLSDWVTALGVVVTLISMAVSIRQAASAQRSSNAAKSAMAVVQLAAVGERLKSAQEHIRDIAPEKAQARGYKVGNRFDLIRREFDNALSALPKAGHGSVAREQLTKAQTELNGYQ